MKTKTLYRYLAILLCMMLSATMQLMAQQQISNIHGTIEDEFGPLMSATVVEIDGNGRVINSTLTDMNGNFSMKIVNPKNKIRIQYVGLKPKVLPIDRTTYNIMMESAQQLQEVTVTSKHRMQGNTLHIPEREVPFAKQTISMDDFEGLAITTVDEALQGRIAGLDIISLSGNLGSGSTMRLRGASSLSSSTLTNPLIVVDGNVSDVDMSNFDLSSSNEEKFAELLNINTEDIASITVLKDASATAIYGSQGGNGVIELTTKRGVRGKPRLSYSLKLTTTHQPQGKKLLNGDDYTMLLKESYFNPTQNDNASNINEINYDPNFSEYEQYNNNTDWRKAVTQVGLRQNHYLTISGGGERATFRISGGVDHETGSIICQELLRYSTRANLDYNVSRRIRVQTNFSMTYTDNKRNYTSNLLDIAQKKMPNMSIYEQDPLTGENTGRYYNMLQSGPNIGSEVFKDDQRKYVNPVAEANLAKNEQKTYKLQPELVLNYELLGMEEGTSRLTWRGQVYMDIYNEYVDKTYPSELVSTAWSAGHNTSSEGSNKSVSMTTKHTLTYTPYFGNEDHSLMTMGRMELNSGSSTSQNIEKVGLPSGITNPNAGGQSKNMGSNYAEWRSLYFTFSAHYSYKSRYMAQFSMRADGTTKFGPDNRWGIFPSLSLRWNVADENFMEPLREKGLSMFSIRPSWGRTGNAPSKDYLYVSQYASSGNYLDMTSMRPINLRLTNLKWETKNQYNLGFDFGFWDDRLTTTFEIYKQTISDMLMEKYSIPSNSGFAELSYRNVGKMSNTGWEFYVNTNRLIKHGKFSMDLNVNFGNNRNEILEMDASVLENLNTTFKNENRQVLTRVQEHNPFGSIYGFRSKGVYQYEYETFAAMSQEQQKEFLASGKTAPVARNADGQVIFDENGNPIRMMFNYSNDGSGRNYYFRGGDAIYEDVNNDGQINALDICYLGSSLPKLIGGFGFNFNYGDWRLSTQFTYRVGNKILNLARLDSEAMNNNDNQSQAVNYRWRKEGDVTSIPRAMYDKNSNYNTLISDRFVENGSYLRMSYVQLSYGLKKPWLKQMGVNKVSLYLSANNPFVLTKYTGVDPDIASWGYGPATDNSQTPRARTFTFSLNVD